MSHPFLTEEDKVNLGRFLRNMDSVPSEKMVRFTHAVWDKKGKLNEQLDTANTQRRFLSNSLPFLSLHLKLVFLFGDADGSLLKETQRFEGELSGSQTMIASLRSNVAAQTRRANDLEHLHETAKGIIQQQVILFFSIHLQKSLKF